MEIPWTKGAWRGPRSGPRRAAAGWRAALAGLALAACWATVPAQAQEPAAAEPGTEAAAPEPELIEPAARDAVKRMVETLTAAERMAYAYESEFDVVQADGELLSFGGRGEVAIRRPDRLRGQVWHRDGRHVRYAWDGTTVALHDETNGVYAATPRSGDLDGLVDFLRDDVGFRLPLADLFKSDLRALLVENVVAARHLGKEALGGLETEHVALRLRTGIDAQLWIRTGEPALPYRITLNFATADGRPQFRARFDDWDLRPRLGDGQFTLAAPRGARIVPFVLPAGRRAAAATQEDSR